MQQYEVVTRNVLINIATFCWGHSQPLLNMGKEEGVEW